MVHVRGYAQCAHVTDPTGAFEFDGLPQDSVVVFATRPAFCVYPMQALPGPQATVELRGGFSGNPLDDAQLLIRGTPWLPPTYAVAHCRAENRRWRLEESVPTEWEIATPPEALRMVLNHPAVADLLPESAGVGATTPVWFRYGEVGEPGPAAPWQYHLVESNTDGVLYAVVVDSGLRRLRVQIAWRAPPIGARPSIEADEDGLIIEWERTESGWGLGAVVEVR